LPSAIDHRPLRFEELEATLGRKELDEVALDEAAADLELVSDAHQQVLASQKEEKKADSSLLNREARKVNQHSVLSQKIKKGAKSIFLSATPAEYELELSEQVVEQIIRPTGLLDPITFVYPKSGDYQLLLDSLPKLLEKKPYLQQFLDQQEEKKAGSLNFEDFFSDEHKNDD
jgi:uvrABC system protein B